MDVSNKVLITGTGVSDSAVETLRAAGLTVANPTHHLTEAELAQELEGAVAYLLDGEEFVTADALAGAKDLRIIAYHGVGYQSSIDMSAADRLGIVVTNTPGTLTEAVAEFTVGQIINANRRLTQYANAVRAGRRGTEEKQRDLVARHVGLIGLGAIGSRIAEILRKGFGVTVSYYTRSRRPALEESLGVAYLDLGSLARSCDVIVVMTPGNDTTWDLVDDDFLQALPPGAILINTARPRVVSPAALRRALRDGPLSLAVFDGFYDAPTGPDLLAEFSEDRLLVTGHIASLTHEARNSMSRMAVQSILNVLATGTDDHAVGAAGRR